MYKCVCSSLDLEPQSHLLNLKNQAPLLSVHSKAALFANYRLYGAPSMQVFLQYRVYVPPTGYSGLEIGMFQNIRISLSLSLSLSLAALVVALHHGEHITVLKQGRHGPIPGIFHRIPGSNTS